MYLISVTPDTYLLATRFNTIETTMDEDKAPRFSNDDARTTLKELKRLGFDALLVKEY